MNLNPFMTKDVIIKKPVIDLQSISMDWFLYDNGLRHETVKANFVNDKTDGNTIIIY